MVTFMPKFRALLGLIPADLRHRFLIALVAVSNEAPGAVQEFEALLALLALH
jgi:hypothetical protein